MCRRVGIFKTLRAAALDLSENLVPRKLNAAAHKDFLPHHVFLPGIGSRAGQHECSGPDIESRSLLVFVYSLSCCSPGIESRGRSFVSAAVALGVTVVGVQFVLCM